jgi:20S proteasome alpha/beta subunit
MNPKPHCHPKRPKKKKMTIAAGFFFKDGIVVCADREESSGASKKSVSKLFNLNSEEWTIVGATAGSGPAADLAVKRLRWEFVKTFALSLGSGSALALASPEEHLENAIINVLTKVHEDHIWKNTHTDHSMRMIIAINFFKTGQQYLYRTEDNIPQPIETYCCMGYGEDLCTYFAERLYHRELNKDEMALLAAFIFREVNASVQFCGKGTDMALMRKGIRSAAYIKPHGVESIQREIPEFSATMSSFWNGTKSLPNWLTSVLNAEEEMK